MAKNGRTAEHEERLAKALRANLARRKAQARARQAGHADIAREPSSPQALPDAQKPQEREG